MDNELRHRIEDFLYLEAELLDDRKLREWLDLLTDDVRYWMPIRYNPLDRPPSRTRHLISNVRIKNDTGSEIEVDSNFLVYRTRMETDQDIFVGMRRDMLRRVNDSFKIAKRTIILDQAVLSAKNISVFL